MADKKIADDRLHQWRQSVNTKVQVVRDFDENAGGRLLKSPDHEHAFGKSLQVTKPHLDFFAINDLLRCPGNWDAGSSGGHDYNVTISSALEIPDITIMWQNLWPVL